jgi:hypothetical protein
MSHISRKTRSGSLKKMDARNCIHFFYWRFAIDPLSGIEDYPKLTHMGNVQPKSEVVECWLDDFKPAGAVSNPARIIQTGLAQSSQRRLRTWVEPNQLKKF